MKPVKKTWVHPSDDSQIKEWLREIRIEKIRQSQERKQNKDNKISRYFN